MGIALFISGFFWLKSGLTFKKDAVEVTAEISAIESYRGGDGEISHRVFINYEFNGKTYSNIPLNEYNSGMYEGKEITVLCRPSHPKRIQTTAGIYLGGCIMLGMGTLFAAIGIIPIIVLSVGFKQLQPTLCKCRENHL